MRLLTLIFDLLAMMLQCATMICLKSLFSGDDPIAFYAFVLFFALNIAAMLAGYHFNRRIQPEKENKFLNSEKAPSLAAGVCLPSAVFFLANKNVDAKVKREVAITAFVVGVYFVMTFFVF